MNTLEKIQQSQVSVSKITLAPLQMKHINQLIADTLSCSIEVTMPLADLVTQKTGGNPFFIAQFLYSLYQDGFIIFNPSSTKLENNKQSYWQWDLTEIKSLSITDKGLPKNKLFMLKNNNHSRSVGGRGRWLPPPSNFVVELILYIINQVFLFKCIWN